MNLMNLWRRFFELRRTSIAKSDLPTAQTIGGSTPPTCGSGQQMLLCVSALCGEIRFSSRFATHDLFPVNSLFLYMPLAKTRNPCGFSNPLKKIPCYQELRIAESLWVLPSLATGYWQPATDYSAAVARAIAEQ